MQNWFAAFQLALALSSELAGVMAAIKAKQPCVIGDPNTGGGIRTYLEGNHVVIGPIPINPA
jgi:hypothetical protein